MLALSRRACLVVALAALVACRGAKRQDRPAADAAIVVAARPCLAAPGPSTEVSMVPGGFAVCEAATRCQRVDGNTGEITPVTRPAPWRPGLATRQVLTSRGAERCAGDACFPLARDPYTEQTPTEGLVASDPGGVLAVTDRQAIHVFAAGKRVRSIDPWDGDPGQVVTTAIGDVLVKGQRILVVDETIDDWQIVIFGSDGSRRGHLGGPRPVSVVRGGVTPLDDHRVAALASNLQAIHIYDANGDHWSHRALNGCPPLAD